MLTKNYLVDKITKIYVGNLLKKFYISFTIQLHELIWAAIMEVLLLHVKLQSYHQHRPLHSTQLPNSYN